MKKIFEGEHRLRLVINAYYLDVWDSDSQNDKLIVLVEIKGGSEHIVLRRLRIHYDNIVSLLHGIAL